MPYYSCPTCQRQLAPNELRRNKEFLPPKQGATGFAHLQNSPLFIGVPLGDSSPQTITRLRCVHCGSDAYLSGYTEAERKNLQEKEEAERFDEKCRNWWKIWK
jgi:ribosomal protein L33